MKNQSKPRATDATSMGIITRTIPAKTTGRYLVEMPDVTGPWPLLVGFHGYAETAEQHLDDLRRLPGASASLLCAVQALHRFYTRSGEVVGSWMTRLDREQVIADNIRYVDDVVSRVMEECGSDGHLIFAGFSQGVAMAYRAAAHGRHRCEGVIALGGDVPPELKADVSMAMPPVLIGRGRRDDWYTQEQLDDDVAFLLSRHVDVEALVFEGGHEWTAEFLGAAGEFLARRGLIPRLVEGR